MGHAAPENRKQGSRSRKKTFKQRARQQKQLDTRELKTVAAQALALLAPALFLQVATEFATIDSVFSPPFIDCGESKGQPPAFRLFNLRRYHSDRCRSAAADSRVHRPGTICNRSLPGRCGVCRIR